MAGNGLRFTSVAAMPAGLRAAAERQGVGDHAREPAPRPNKYGNKPTTVDGIRFDSKKEARYYEELKIRREVGEVAYFLMQVPIRLPDGTRYVVDFLVFFADGRPPEYVDVKGKETPVFRMKKKAVEHHYPLRVTLV